MQIRTLLRPQTADFRRQIMKAGLVAFTAAFLLDVEVTTRFFWVLLVLWLWSGEPIQRGPLTRPLLFFAGIQLVSLAWTMLIFDSLYQAASVLIPGLFFFFIVTSTVQDEDTLSDTLLALSAGVAAIAAYAIYQHFAGIRRPESLIENTNILAMVLNVCIPIFVGAAVSPATGGRRRMWYAFLVGLSTLAVIFTQSRAGWVAAVVVYLVLAVLLRSGHLLAGLGATTLLTPLMFPAGHVVARAASIGPSGLATRLKIWIVSLDLIGQRPILGAGLFTFGKLYGWHPGVTLTRTAILHAHNLLLNMWVEAGILGVVALIWLNWAYATESRRLLAKTRFGSHYGVVVGLVAGFVGYMVHNLASVGPASAASWLILILNVALLDVSGRLASRGTRETD